MKKIENTYVNDSRFMELIDEIATQITEMNFGDDTTIGLDDGSTIFTDDAQDYYNEKSDEYETMINKLIGVYKHDDMIMHIYPTKINK
tara:strand:+ start:229 stop:492 length:264 start_codon:yes stop_codon:yes gene_type:complete